MCAGGFEFSFEYDEALTVNDYRRLIVEEAASFRAEKALARRLRAEKLASMGQGPDGQPLAADGPGSVGAGGDEDMGGHAVVGAVQGQFPGPQPQQPGQQFYQ